ncbi:MAG: VWA-like domain-containing protein, partial [Pseudomonadota bacterium]
HTTRAAAALRRLSEADPALAALGFWCVHRDTDPDAWPGPGDRTPPARDRRAWSDAQTVHYGPDFERLSEHEQIGLAAHHILHIAFRHAVRARAMADRLADRFDPALYGLVTDAIVNETLIAAGYALPRPCPVLSVLVATALGEAMAPGEALARWDADALYMRLKSASGRRQGIGADDGDKGAPTSAESAAERYGRESGFAPDLDWQGSAADAPPQAGQTPDGSDDGADRHSPAHASKSAKQSEAEWRERIARALAEGRAAGRGLGMLGHRLGDLPQAATPWEVVLRGLLTRAVTPQPRLGWQRPARGWLAADSEAHRLGAPRPAPLPAVLRDATVPRIAVCIDCSGSVDEARLGLFAAQIAGIGRRLSAQIHVLVFDSAVRSHHRMGPGAWEGLIRSISFARDGGTDFGPALEAAAALSPSAIVVLTDLDGPFGPAPRAPVIWAVPDETARRPPPFGRVLSLAR